MDRTDRHIRSLFRSAITGDLISRERLQRHIDRHYDRLKPCICISSLVRNRWQTISVAIHELSDWPPRVNFAWQNPWDEEDAEYYYPRPIHLRFVTPIKKRKIDVRKSTSS